MHRRVMLSLLGAILVAMLAVAGAQSRPQAGTVNIGWSGDKSGPTVASQGPALDGLRGLAVIGVIAFHADLLRGGYLGVDLFFVLSGYLITSLLLVEQRLQFRLRT